MQITCSTSNEESSAYNPIRVTAQVSGKLQHTQRSCYMMQFVWLQPTDTTGSDASLTDSCHDLQDPTFNLGEIQ
ncbi:hypothetical protein RRG08_066305 [Elysia crispata]|uniref:Uncharacterized protein n=1 Tax=Elysia crispata TaxID=231223 RepID=A0AAE1AMS2_9GAST|nr:hypothetical protein RRG08_066305 [Elysia crispata]